MSWKLYPNVFTVLVGRPGIGKGAAVNPALGLLKEANTANVLSDRLTIQYILQRLAEGFPVSGTGAQGGVTFGTEATALLFSPELSIFVTSNDTFPILADLWDGRCDSFMYGTRQRGQIVIKNGACVTMLAGSSPEWLVKSIPASAVAGGFTRRVNFVYAREKEQSIPMPIPNGSSKQRDGLVDDLRHISQLHGEIKLGPGVEKDFIEYYNAQKPDEFDDEATAGYVSTKWAHAMKLAMILSVSQSDSMLIERQTFQDACTLVERVQADIKLVFRAVGESDLASVADKVLRFLESQQRQMRGATRKQILHALWRDVIGQDLDMILATLEQGGFIDIRQHGNSTMYFPLTLPTPAAKAAKTGRP